MVKSTPSKVKKETGKRVLALDVRPQRAGYALFEGAQLLDWGVTTYGIGGTRVEMTARQRITDLLDRHDPRFVIMRNRRIFPARSGQTLIAIIRMIRSATARRSIRFRTLSAETLKHFYSQHSCKNKAQVAALIASRYPELASKLPPKRKPWQRENNNAVIFDAVAVAVAFQNNVDQNTMTE